MTFSLKFWRHMVPFADLDYPFSTYWPSLNGEPDVLVEILGDVGYWQLLVVTLMMLFNLPTVFHVASPEVSAVNHDYWCRRMDNKFTLKKWLSLCSVKETDYRNRKVTDPCRVKDLPYAILTYEELKQLQANGTRKCYKWDFSPTKASILSAFQLACRRIPVNNVAEIMFSIGAAFGGLLNSYIADRFGRRKLLMSCQIVNVLIGFCIANTTSFTNYLFYRLLLGFTCSAVFLCSFIICIEIANGKWRDTLTTVYMYSYSLGYMILHVFGSLFNSWIYLQYSITLVAIFLISIWWINPWWTWTLLLTAWSSNPWKEFNDDEATFEMVPESPRWLLTAHNLPKLMVVLETASDYNRKPMMPGSTSRLRKMLVMKIARVEPNPLMLFRGHAMRRLSIVIPCASFFSSVTYFGLVLNNDLFTLGLLYSGLVEFAAISVVLILRIHDDVLMVCITNALSGVSCLIAAGLTQYGLFQDVAVVAARFFGGMVNSSLTTIIATMNPTLIRTLGMGWGNFFTNVALGVAANIFLLSTLFPWLPLVVLGISGLLASLSLLFLPGRVTRDLLDLPAEVEYGHKVMAKLRRTQGSTYPPVHAKASAATIEELENRRAFS